MNLPMPSAHTMKLRLAHTSSPRTNGHSRRLSQLQTNILKTLLYFDVFAHPLTLEELCLFLPSQSVTADEIEKACQNGALREVVDSQQGFYYLKHRSETITFDRVTKERRARRMLGVAQLMTRIVAGMPYVRAVFLSGELSKGVATVGGDIDFFIVTSPHRVWIVRTLCTAFKKSFLLNQRKFFCCNHIVSEEDLEVHEHNVYTAIELATLQPLMGNGLMSRIQQANSWMRVYLPNIPKRNEEKSEFFVRRSILERVLDRTIKTTLLDRIDRWLQDLWSGIWARRYPAFDPDKRARILQCTQNVSTAYLRDYSPEILGRYSENLMRYGLD
jgi:hypothetical protein